MYRPGEIAKLYPKNEQKGYDVKITNKKNGDILEKLIVKHTVNKPDRVV